MDPVSQGVLGALVSQTSAQKSRLTKSAIIGALAAMAPDLDVFIRSSSDPLLALEFHRHFTHSLFFIPLGALLCSLVFYPLLARRWQLSYRTTYLWCLLGFATHALLDGCTSYGTQLLWPLSNQRFAWDIVPIVDPLFTLPLLLWVFLACRRQSRRWLGVGLAWLCLYIGLGYWQHQRAEQLAWQLAQERGHEIIRLEIKPSFANLVVWKSIYETRDRFYVDAIKPGWQKPLVWPGDSIVKLDVDRQLPWLDKQSQQARDIERFSWFSAGYLAIDPKDPSRVVDVRYSMLPHTISPLWGIKLSMNAQRGEHVDYYVRRDNPKQSTMKIFDMMFE